ncbi:hypothetical protein [Halobacterium sp. CBA1126]|uniref:hypothetical protein n=1 Tax=Halobacterium sp. CBA1126 TaxID=2668074 RepID=UPI0012F9F5CA|nr:hypothetical protein [Halobacterium sp. CBA1126]MUV59955.1 hypothetical protein [Halobacterium sp. CBA1126]
MRSAILYQLTGNPDGELPNQLEGGLPAATAETTKYLDGREITAGTLAGYTTTKQDVPVVGEDFIATEREETKDPAIGDYHADLELGWAGITTQDIEPLLVDYIASHASVVPEDAELNLDAFAERLPDDVDTNGVVYSTSVDDGHDRDAAGSHWQRDATPSKIPVEGTSVLHVRYTWDGVLVDAMLAQSGYVAVYKDWTAETFARWIAAEVEPYLSLAARDEQATLDDAGDEPEVCENCGREPDRGLKEASDGRMVCLVCKDDIDNRGEA